MIDSRLKRLKKAIRVLKKQQKALDKAMNKTCCTFVRQPAMLYRCNKCHRTYKRNSKKLWIKSFCTHTGHDARLYRINRLKTTLREHRAMMREYRDCARPL